MTNKDFYAFCRDQRKTEPDPHKKAVLQEVYNFMFECSTTKSGMKQFIERLMHEPKNATKVSAYQWLPGVFDGPSEPVVPDGQMKLF